MYIANIRSRVFTSFLIKIVLIRCDLLDVFDRGRKRPIHSTKTTLEGGIVLALVHA